MSCDHNNLLYTSLLENFKIKTNTVAVIDNGISFTYKDLWLNSRKFAIWIDSNTEQKSRVGIMLDNNINTVYVMYGITIAGRICVPLDTDMHQKNLNYMAI